MSTLRPALAAALLIACTGGTTDSEDSGEPSVQVCEATFAWLQKDAYRESAGRSSDLWPPHTTTTLEVSCTTDDEAPEQVHSVFMANHGTEPGQVDAADDVILVQMKSEALGGLSREEADALVTAYRACECANGGTAFLSLDDLDGATVEALVGQVSNYVVTYLDCGDTPVEELIAALQAGDIETVLATLPGCTWQEDHDWSTGLSEAMLEVVGDVGETLDDYHVCNNDAVLQSTLWAEAVAGTIGTCDASTATCRGPLWLYTP